jgi:hypothetical protein
MDRDRVIASRAGDDGWAVIVQLQRKSPVVRGDSGEKTRQN